MDATQASTNVKSPRKPCTEAGAMEGAAVEGDAVRPTTLASVFAVLDRLLAVAVDRQARRLGPASLLDPWRGMHLDADDVRGALASTPHTALASEGFAAIIAGIARREPKLSRIATWLGLTAADTHGRRHRPGARVDLRYERIYAYLQDDITRKRPSVDLVAWSASRRADERSALLRRFDRLGAGARWHAWWRGASEVPLLARPLALDALWRNFLLGRDELDPQLACLWATRRRRAAAESTTLSWKRPSATW